MEFEVRLGRVTEWDVFASGVGGQWVHSAEHELLRQCWQRHANRLQEQKKERCNVWVRLPVFWLTITEPNAQPQHHHPVPLSPLPLTLKQGFLCQRTSCTWQLKRSEGESAHNCKATKCILTCVHLIMTFFSHLSPTFFLTWFQFVSEGRKWLISRGPDIWALCCTAFIPLTKHRFSSHRAEIVVNMQMSATSD